MPHLSGDSSCAKNRDPGLFCSKGFGTVKLIIGLAFVFSLAALAATFFLAKALKEEKKQRQALEAAHEQIREKSASLDHAARQYQSEIRRMREQLKAYALERKQLQDQIQQSSPKVETPAAQSGNLKNTASVEAQAAPREAAPSALVEAVLAVSGKALPAQTADGKSAALPVVPTVKPESAAASETTKDVSQPEAAASAPAPEEKQAPSEAKAKSASILTVNRKFNFAVVNIGLQDGVQIGDLLLVERSGKENGNLKVEKTYENFSAAAIIKEDSKTPIQQGDLIRKG